MAVVKALVCTSTRFTDPRVKHVPRETHYVFYETLLLSRDDAILDSLLKIALTIDCRVELMLSS